ncbi:Cysteine protease [Rhynchospora pubera]|uniref:Cysteine protease n=1 Tax=Rhynchospora pubera TaxID=906938 RepID=A0AAV8CI54_9POAL|nr:Cysteine protease [Rhynchospora pubera]
MAFSNHCSTIQLLSVLIFVLFAGTPIFTAGADDPLLPAFEKWMKDYNRTYDSPTEKLQRLQVFKDNFQFIESMKNQTGLTYTVGLNDFADLTNQEFLQRYTMNRPLEPSNESTPFMYANVTSIPSSIDWRTLGAVTPIKSQDSCGACWAFWAVASIEGINKIKTGNLISLSEQELVDCDTTCYGCNGGLAYNAFQWVVQNGGITAEEDYPYTSGTTGTGGTCSNTSNYAATISGYQYVTAYSESDLAKAVANQPVSIRIDASGSAFQFYSGGIFSGPCERNLNHAVNAVGYGICGGNKYWIVKNSWGTSWGESGYIRMKKDICNNAGLCGLAIQPSYPTK